MGVLLREYVYVLQYKGEVELTAVETKRLSGITKGLRRGTL